MDNLLKQAIEKITRLIEMIEYLQENGDGATVAPIPNVEIVATYVDRHGDKVVLTVEDLKLLVKECQA